MAHAEPERTRPTFAAPDFGALRRVHSGYGSQCSTCGVFGTVDRRLFICQRCRRVWYCGKECQTKGWKKGGHKQQCHESVLQPPSLSVPSLQLADERLRKWVHKNIVHIAHLAHDAALLHNDDQGDEADFNGQAVHITVKEVEDRSVGFFRPLRATLVPIETIRQRYLSICSPGLFRSFMDFNSTAPFPIQGVVKVLVDLNNSWYDVLRSVHVSVAESVAADRKAMTRMHDYEDWFKHVTATNGRTYVTASGEVLAQREVRMIVPAGYDPGQVLPFYYQEPSM